MGDSSHNLTIDGGKLIKDLKVVELKIALEKRGLSKLGNKRELTQRLSIFEENQQKSQSVQPTQEVPNQWLENEADLNNDFLREYFKSQKALFQEHIARQSDKGVSESPRDTSTFAASKVSSVNNDGLHNPRIRSSSTNTCSSSSSFVASGTAKSTSRGRPKKKLVSNEKKREKSDIMTEVNSKSNVASVRSLRSRISTCLSDEIDDSANASLSSLSTPIQQNSRRTRSEVRVTSPHHITNVDSKRGLSEEDSKIENSLSSRVPSLKIKISESVPDPKASNAVVTTSLSKVKCLAEADILKQSLKAKTVCLSPQNAEVSSSVQEESNRKLIPSKYSSSGSQDDILDNDIIAPTSSSLPSDIEKQVISPSTISKSVKVPLKRIADFKHIKNESLISSKSQIPPPKWKREVIERKRTRLKVKTKENYSEKEQLSVDRSSSIENKLKKDLVNLRLRSSDSTEKDLSINIPPSKKSNDLVRRSSRLSKPSVLPKSNVGKMNKITESSALSHRANISTITTKTSAHPDFIESLKQQIEMPLHVEKFPHSDKSEVSSTSEIIECPKVIEEFCASRASTMRVSKDSAILDTNIAVRGCLEDKIVPDSRSDSFSSLGVNNSEISPRLRQNTQSVKQHESSSLHKEIGTVLNQRVAPNNKSYSIESLIDISGKEILKPKSLLPLNKSHMQSNVSIEGISSKLNEIPKVVCVKIDNSQSFPHAVSQPVKDESSSINEKEDISSTLQYSTDKTDSDKESNLFHDILKEATLAANINEESASEFKEIKSPIIPSKGLVISKLNSSTTLPCTVISTISPCSSLTEVKQELFKNEDVSSEKRSVNKKENISSTPVAEDSRFIELSGNKKSTDLSLPKDSSQERDVTLSKDNISEHILKDTVDITRKDISLPIVESTTCEGESVLSSAYQKHTPIPLSANEFESKEHFVKQKLVESSLDSSFTNKFSPKMVPSNIMKSSIPISKIPNDLENYTEELSIPKQISKPDASSPSKISLVEGKSECIIEEKNIEKENSKPPLENIKKSNLTTGIASTRERSREDSTPTSPVDIEDKKLISLSSGATENPSELLTSEKGSLTEEKGSCQSSSFPSKLEDNLVRKLKDNDTTEKKEVISNTISNNSAAKAEVSLTEVLGKGDIETSKISKSSLHSSEVEAKADESSEKSFAPLSTDETKNSSSINSDVKFESRSSVVKDLSPTGSNIQHLPPISSYGESISLKSPNVISKVDAISIERISQQDENEYNKSKSSIEDIKLPPDKPVKLTSSKTEIEASVTLPSEGSSSTSKFTKDALLERLLFKDELQLSRSKSVQDVESRGISLPIIPKNNQPNISKANSMCINEDKKIKISDIQLPSDCTQSKPIFLSDLSKNVPKKEVGTKEGHISIPNTTPPSVPIKNSSKTKLMCCPSLSKTFKPISEEAISTSPKTQIFSSPSKDVNKKAIEPSNSTSSEQKPPTVKPQNLSHSSLGKISFNIKSLMSSSGSKANEFGKESSNSTIHASSKDSKATAKDSVVGSDISRIDKVKSSTTRKEFLVIQGESSVLPKDGAIKFDTNLSSKNSEKLMTKRGVSDVTSQKDSLKSTPLEIPSPNLICDISSIPLPPSGMKFSEAKISFDCSSSRSDSLVDSSGLSEVDQMARSSRHSRKKTDDSSKDETSSKVEKTDKSRSTSKDSRKKSPEPVSKDEPARRSTRRTRSNQPETHEDEPMKNDVDARKSKRNGLSDIAEGSEELNSVQKENIAEKPDGNSEKEEINNVNEHSESLKEMEGSSLTSASVPETNDEVKENESFSKRPHSLSPTRRSKHRKPSLSSSSLEENPNQDPSVTKVDRLKGQSKDHSIPKKGEVHSDIRPEVQSNEGTKSVDGGDNDVSSHHKEADSNESKKAIEKSKEDQSSSEKVHDENAEFKSARKVTLHRTKSLGEDEKEKPKKKKWGSSAPDSTSVEISSESLKCLVPDVKPLSPGELTLQLESGKEIEEFAKELDEDRRAEREEGERTPSPSNDSTLENRKRSSLGSEKDGDVDLSTERENKETISRKEKSKHEKEHTTRSSSRHNRHRSSSREKQKKKKRDREEKSSSRRTGSSPSRSRRRKDDSTEHHDTRKVVAHQSRHPISPVLIVRNLVRPFTLKQLEALLLRTGKIVPDGFWIDSIKSKCIVKFENEDQALETRMALHGVKWPSSNPKNLHVEYCSQDELERKINEGFNQLNTSTSTTDDFKIERRGSIREWDLEKLGESSPGEREREKERRRREKEELRAQQKEEQSNHSRREEKSSKKSQPVVKSLDDLFKKTKAQPSIYWLPLNNEQIVEKEELRRKRIDETERRYAELKAEREKQRQEREEEAKKRQEQREERKREREKEQRERRNSRRSRSRSRRRSRSRSNNRKSSPRSSRTARTSRRSTSRSDARKSGGGRRSTSKSRSRSRS